MGLFSRKKSQVDPTYSAFTSGRVVALSDVPDPVFAQKMMGDGFAIEPTSSDVVAPCDGEMTVVFPTGHAYGIKRQDGVEVLVHLGIDTVELNGEGFKVHVKKGQHVKRGDKLATVDWDFIKDSGKPIISPMLITSGQSVSFNYSQETITPEAIDVLIIK